MKNTYEPTNQYHAPLAEKMDDELILAIRKGQSDATACHAQLIRNGWKPEHIAKAVNR